MPENSTPKHTIVDFDPKLLKKNSRVIFTGASESGKSTAILEFLRYTIKWASLAVIFCGTLDTAEGYAKHTPGSFVFVPDSAEMEKKHYDYIEELLDKQKVDKALGKLKEVVLIIDDLAHDMKFMKSKLMRKLLFAGRHYGITLFVAQQDVLCMPKPVRGCFNFVVHSKENSIRERQRIYEAYPGVLAPFENFDRVFTAMTGGDDGDDYGQLVLYNGQGRGSKIENNVWWMKARFPTPKFRINKRSRMWKWHDKHYDKFHALRQSKYGASVLQKMQGGKKSKTTKVVADMERGGIVKGRRKDTKKKEKAKAKMKKAEKKVKKKTYKTGFVTPARSTPFLFPPRAR